jgi:hypothetical protein
MAINDLPGCGWIAPAAGKSLDALQRHLPIGVAWLAFRMPGKVAYLLIKALARAFDDAWDFLCKVAAELDPRTTTELVGEWERAVGLPDACLPKATTIEERRAQIMFRLAKRRWTTAQDWHDLAELYGLEIEITPGWLVQKPALYGFEYPRRYDVFPKLGRFRVYIDLIGIEANGYPYGAAGGAPGYGTTGVPYGLQLQGFDAFRCIIERVSPANVVVIWNDNPLRNGCYDGSFSEEFAAAFCGIIATEPT